MGFTLLLFLLTSVLSFELSCQLYYLIFPFCWRIISYLLSCSSVTLRFFMQAFNIFILRCITLQEWTFSYASLHDTLFMIFMKNKNSLQQNSSPRHFAFQRNLIAEPWYYSTVVEHHYGTFMVHQSTTAVQMWVLAQVSPFDLITEAAWLHYGHTHMQICI